MLYYCSMYYQCSDAVVTTIQDQFHQHDYSLYSMMEQLLIKATSNGEYSMELKEVTDFYQADFNKSELVTQLQLLSCMDIKCSITFKISTNIKRTNLMGRVTWDKNESCEAGRV